MILFPFLSVCLILSTCKVTVGKQQSNCFRAAVLDHVHQNNFTIDQRERNVELNWKVYENAASIAKANDVDIIVFPENGLLYRLARRDVTLRVSETIPNANEVLCQSTVTSTISIVSRLSCLAKKHKMFVVANVLDKQSCQTMKAEKSDKCPKDKYFVFNTAVLFDRGGKLLGKYHKMHLFGEMNLNPPPKEELVVFNTELGRLGIQICFDLIYKKPGVHLAQQKLVDTILLPTWWFDEAPFLSASQYQMSWAVSNKVNLLASNIQYPEAGSIGSGVYAGSSEQFVTVSSDDGQVRLIMGTVSKSALSKHKCDIHSKVVIVPQTLPVKPNHKYNYQQMNLSDTEIVLLERNKEKASVCRGRVCCTLQYKFDLSTPKNSYEEYYLITSDRTRPGPYPWGEEFCAFVNCPEVPNKASCSVFRNRKELQSRFYHLKLTGQFSKDTTVYPSAIGSNHKVIEPKGNWKFSKLSQKQSDTSLYMIEFGTAESTKSQPISTLGLYGRAYSRDPQYRQVPTGFL